MALLKSLSGQEQPTLCRLNGYAGIFGNRRRNVTCLSRLRVGKKDKTIVT